MADLPTRVQYTKDVIQVFLPTLGQNPILKKTGKEKEAVSAEEAAAANMMLPGRGYPFHLIFSNPLYDPITVRLSVQRSFPVSAPPLTAPETPSTPVAPPTQAPARRPPYAISLPTTSFLVNPFAEAWEYEDDEDEEMFDEEELGLNLGISRTPGRGSSGRDGGGASRSKVKTVGVLERRANVTKIGGEVVVSKEGKGAVKVRFFNIQALDLN